MALDDLADQISLQTAYGELERSNFLIELANLIGKPIEIVVNNLPRNASESIEKATSKALQAALRIALSSMDLQHRGASSEGWHCAGVTLSGGIGGLFGWAGLGVELPISTTLILRSIADIARAEGENLQKSKACLACIEVFALGGRTSSDDAAESGYFSIRAALAKAVSEAAAYVAERGMAEEAAPVLIRLVAKIAQRFAPAVADKVAAQAAPLFGAIGGAGVNLIFISHFQGVARGHFTIRRLERKYGPERIRAEYEHLRQSPT